MEREITEFITFCTEMYAKKNKKKGSEVARLFCEEKVFEFLEENFLELHTQGKEYLISLIEDFIKSRKK